MTEIRSNPKGGKLELVQSGNVEVNATALGAAYGTLISNNHDFELIMSVYVLTPEQVALSPSSPYFDKVNLFFFGSAINYVDIFYYIQPDTLSFWVNLGSGAGVQAVGIYQFRYYIYRMRAK